ncbi:hypothetical protein F9H62_01750 [Vibrio alginolyticus]|nr:hypothetical protein [Vibrio alginolyticus]
MAAHSRLSHRDFEMLSTMILVGLFRTEHKEGRSMKRSHIYRGLPKRLSKGIITSSINCLLKRGLIIEDGKDYRINPEQFNFISDINTAFWIEFNSSPYLRNYFDR